MSLIQRNVIPLFILLAVVGIGVSIFAASSPFASGQEAADSCEPGVGISIATTNAAGETVAVVSDGDEIFYRVKLFKEESLCDFGDGTLTVTLPGATEAYPDGVAVISVTKIADDDTEQPYIVQIASPYNSGSIGYIVDQNDGVQTTAEDTGSVELTVRAVYEDGRSYNSEGNELPNEVDATATSIVRIQAPAVEITVSPSVEDPNSPDTQSVLQGQEALFDIVVENTGGFELSNIVVTSLADEEANEVVVMDCHLPTTESGALGPLAVGDSTSAYQCGTTTEATFVLRAQVTADATAQSTTGEAVSMEVVNDDTTTVFYGTVDVNIDISAVRDVVRYSSDEEAREGEFNIVVTTPAASDLENVTVTATVAGPDADEASSADDCSREFGTVPAADDSKPAELAGYLCSAKMFSGLNTITATVEGTIPGTETVLTATDDTLVEAISPGLTVELTPQDQTIRSGESATITVTVTNGATDLTGVQVIDPDPNNTDGLDLSSCSTSPDDEDISLSVLGDISAFDELVIICSTAILTEATGYEAVAIGTAPDNTTEPSAVSTAVVNILSPSTDVSVSALEGGSTVVRLVVQTVVVTESNDGDSDLTNIFVDVDAAGIGPDLTSRRLTRESPEFVGSHGEDANDDDVLNPGETWEWRVVIVGVAGNVVLLDADATGMDITASGYGTDELDGEVSPETDADEIETQTFPVVVN